MLQTLVPKKILQERKHAEKQAHDSHDACRRLGMPIRIAGLSSLLRAAKADPTLVAVPDRCHERSTVCDQRPWSN